MIGAMQDPVVLERTVLDAVLDALRRLAKDDPGARDAYLRLVPAVARSTAELELAPDVREVLAGPDPKPAPRKLAPLHIERATGGGRPE